MVAVGDVAARHAPRLLARQRFFHRGMAPVAPPFREHGYIGGPEHRHRLPVQPLQPLFSLLLDGARHRAACLFRGIGRRRGLRAAGPSARRARERRHDGGHPQAGRPATRHRAAYRRRRHPMRGPGRRRASGRSACGASGRPDRRGRGRCGGCVLCGREHAERRTRSGGQGPIGPRFRRHGQSARHVPLPGRRGRRRYDARADHPPRAGCAGQQGSGAEARGPHRRRLRAGHHPAGRRVVSPLARVRPRRGVRPRPAGAGHRAGPCWRWSPCWSSPVPARWDWPRRRPSWSV